MDITAFRASLKQDHPPEGLGKALEALWHQGKGDWNRAHQLAQASSDASAAWVHAHLHRFEGNYGNAAYWYRRAGRAPSRAPLNAEWEEIASALLAEPERDGSSSPP